jgi:hypothetical protein
LGSLLNIKTKEKHYLLVTVANKIMQIDELGVEKANKKVQRDFLMKVLKLETAGIVLKDKSELVQQDAEWKYLDN